MKFNGNSLSYTTLECENLTDSFSKSNSSAKLKYSIGLLSYPERLLNAKLGNESSYWLLSASSYSYSGGAVTINSSSNPGGAPYYTSFGVRPVITLKPGTKIEKGTGTYDNPYIVGLN